MSDSKVFMFPDSPNGGGNSNSDLLTLMALMNGGGGFGGGNWMWIIFLFFLNPYMRNGLFGNGGFGGFGGGGNCGCDGNLSNLINNDVGRQYLMDAINGNRSAIDNLATMFNTSVSNIQNALCGLNGSIQNVGNQVGLTGQQVINAIQQGNMSIAQQIAQCCCDNKLLVTQMGYEGQIRDMQNTSALMNRLDVLGNGVQQGFSAVAYETAKQTCDLNVNMSAQTQSLKDTANANNQAILAKLNEMQNTALQSKIDQLIEAKSTLQTQLNLEHQNAITAQTVAQAVSPINAALAGIRSEVDAIKAAQPTTISVQYPDLTVTPKCQPVCGTPCGQQFNGCGWNGNGFWY